jgi:hypothetical protein
MKKLLPVGLGPARSPGRFLKKRPLAHIFLRSGPLVNLPVTRHCHKSASAQKCPIFLT